MIGIEYPKTLTDFEHVDRLLRDRLGYVPFLTGVNQQLEEENQIAIYQRSPAIPSFPREYIMRPCVYSEPAVIGLGATVNSYTLPGSRHPNFTITIKPGTVWLLIEITTYACCRFDCK